MEMARGATGAGDQRPQPSSMFDELRQEIDKMDPYAETITLTYHLRQFAERFQRRINDDQTLNALFAHLNEAALADNKFAVKMATVFASHQFGDVMVHETKIRNAMVGMLQQNFLAIERLKQTNVQRFYNSITLLGEYYNRKKVAYGRRIVILGQSLLLLLTSELEQEINKSTQRHAHQMDAEFAKLLLEQVTLNGAVAKEEHRKEITDLLFTVRKALISVPNLCARAKAFLLMALDLYHSNLAEDLFDKLYNKYLNAPEEHARRPDGNATAEAAWEEPEQTKPSTNGEGPIRRQEKTSPEAVGTRNVGNRMNSMSRGNTGANTASYPHHLTIHDKENKRRPSSRGAGSGNRNTSPRSRRNVRLVEDGNIVTTISRDTPTTPTKRTPPSAPAISSYRAERPPHKKNLPPRFERLAALPKNTVPSLAPSRHGNPPAPSPRPVLGVSSARQREPQHSSKSPIRTTTSRSAPEVHRSPENNAVRNSKFSPPGPAGINRSGMTRREGPPLHSNGTGSHGGNVLKNHGNDSTVPHTKGPPIRESKENTIAERDHTSKKETSLAANDVSAGAGASVGDGTVPNGKTGNCSEGTVNGDSTNGVPAEVPKPKTKAYFLEENMENLSWYEICMLDEEESPQKQNPHTESFLSFLADK